MNDIEKEVLQRLLGDALTELRVLGSYVDHPDTCWPNLGLKVTATAQKKLAQRIEKVLAGKALEKIPCGECGLPLTEVRPGKHQCDNCEASKVIEELKKERDEAQANYRFMVDRAINEKLDGYRAMGAKCAQLEQERDDLRQELDKALELEQSHRDRARQEIREKGQLLEEVRLLQAEVRKQVFGSRVVFDREVVERAQYASDDPLEWPEPKR